MFAKIKEDINRRMSKYNDSRQPTADEINIAWLVAEIDRLNEEDILNGVSDDGQLVGDGFGTIWSNKCPECSKPTIVVERPGVAKCSECSP